VRHICCNFDQVIITFGEAVLEVGTAYLERRHGFVPLLLVAFLGFKRETIWGLGILPNFCVSFHFLAFF